MERSLEEFEDGHNYLGPLDEVQYPPLNLALSVSLEFINFIDDILQQLNPFHLRERLPNIPDYSNTSIPLKKSKNQKPINFQVSKITIGQWTCAAVHPSDIMAKFYLAKEKLIWEFLNLQEPGTNNTTNLKKKIEIQWNDVMSFRTEFHKYDETGILEIELSKPPTFFIETNQRPGKHTLWKQMDQDFTQNQSSVCRRHTLYFQPGILQENLEKLMSNSSFWSELLKVKFPLHECLYFNGGYGSNNHLNYSRSYNHDQRFSFNNVHNANLNHPSQGTGPVGVDERLLHLANQFLANDGEGCLTCLLQFCILHHPTN